MWGRQSPEFQVDIQAWAWRPTCLEAPGRRRESKGKLPGENKINSLPKVQQKWPDLPRRRASSCGESLGWEEQRPFLLAAWAPAAGAGTSLGWDLAQGAGGGWAGKQARCGGSGSGSGTLGPRNMGSCAPGSRQESYSGGALWLSLSHLSRALCKSVSGETGSPACQVQQRE